MASWWGEYGPIALIVLAVIALGMAGWMRLRRHTSRPSPPPRPVAMPPEEAELVEGPVWACMRCGSTDVGPGSVMQGMIPGAGDHFAYVCRRCRHRGPPLEFESVTAYRLFVKGLREGPESAQDQEEER